MASAKIPSHPYPEPCSSVSAASKRTVGMSALKIAAPVDPRIRYKARNRDCLKKIARRPAPQHKIQNATTKKYAIGGSPSCSLLQLQNCRGVHGRTHRYTLR